VVCYPNVAFAVKRRARKSISAVIVASRYAPGGITRCRAMAIETIPASAPQGRFPPVSPDDEVRLMARPRPLRSADIRLSPWWRAILRQLLGRSCILLCGLDVSLNKTIICIVDDAGVIFRVGKLDTEPENPGIAAARSIPASQYRRSPSSILPHQKAIIDRDQCPMLWQSSAAAANMAGRQHGSGK
jgi:hypothetical protein